MKIISNHTEDTRTVPHYSGGYEWWYFDGISDDGKYSFVIIFYEGNPFSLRYIQALNWEEESAPSEYPAISIAVYEDSQPVYYSFTEFEKENCVFKEDQIFVEIGPHQMEGTVRGDKLEYTLQLQEQLPSGDKIEVELRFEGKITGQLFGENGKKDKQNRISHQWNLVLPRASVAGHITLSTGNKKSLLHTIEFNGTGYHDHNTGREPMRNSFEDWYWGRFHFNYATLVYYIMNREEQQQYEAWLIDRQNNQVLTTFDEINLYDQSFSLFGLLTAHKLMFRSKGIEVQVQQSDKQDNGPFYQRFGSQAYLNIPDEEILESQKGISEYIQPSRIYCRLFWPLIRMRIRQASGKPHWVQRSKRLYRWTW